VVVVVVVVRTLSLLARSGWRTCERTESVIVHRAASTDRNRIDRYTSKEIGGKRVRAKGRGKTKSVVLRARVHKYIIGARGWRRAGAGFDMPRARTRTRAKYITAKRYCYYRAFGFGRNATTGTRAGSKKPVNQRNPVRGGRL
jgi:hypothetical protein